MWLGTVKVIPITWLSVYAVYRNVGQFCTVQCSEMLYTFCTFQINFCIFCLLSVMPYKSVGLSTMLYNFVQLTAVQVHTVGNNGYTTITKELGSKKTIYITRKTDKHKSCKNIKCLIKINYFFSFLVFTCFMHILITETSPRW